MMVPSSKAKYVILAGGPSQHNLISLSLQIGNKAPRLEVYTTCQHWGTAIHTTGLYTQYWYNAIWWYWIDVDSTSMIFSMLYSLDSHGYPETHNGIVRSIAMPTLPDGWCLAFNRRQPMMVNVFKGNHPKNGRTLQVRVNDCRSFTQMWFENEIRMDNYGLILRE